MALLKIARLGHPILRQTAEPVAVKSLQSEKLQSFIDDLVETMIEEDGVGLAAPQVHSSTRIVVYRVAEPSLYAKSSEPRLHVLVNPVIAPLGQDTELDWEGCLSVPGLRGRVPRHTAVRVKALDRKGGKLDYVAKDFHARVVQHECDHLDGIVYLDRMIEMTSLSFLEELGRFSQE